METHTENIATTNQSKSYQQAPVTTPTAPNHDPVHSQFLGAPSTGANGMQYLGAFIEAGRSEDYKRELRKVENELSEERSKRRRLEEEIHKLRLDNATADERANLKVQTELLNKKGFFESESVQKMGESLAALAGQIVPQLISKGNAPQAQLAGAPETLSLPKQSAVDLIKRVSDKDAAFVTVLLQNMDEELETVLINHIENKK